MVIWEGGKKAQKPINSFTNEAAFDFLPYCLRGKKNDLKMFLYPLGKAFTPYCKGVDRMLKSGPVH